MPGNLNFKLQVISLLEDNLSQELYQIFRNEYCDKIQQILKARNGVDRVNVTMDYQSWCHLSETSREGAFHGNAFIILTDNSTSQMGEAITDLIMLDKDLQGADFVPVPVKAIIMESLPCDVNTAAARFEYCEKLKNYHDHLYHMTTNMSHRLTELNTKVSDLFVPMSPRTTQRRNLLTKASNLLGSLSQKIQGVFNNPISSGGEKSENSPQSDICQNYEGNNDNRKRRQDRNQCLPGELPDYTERIESDHPHSQLSERVKTYSFSSVLEEVRSKVIGAHELQTPTSPKTDLPLNNMKSLQSTEKILPSEAACGSPVAFNDAFQAICRALEDSSFHTYSPTSVRRYTGSSLMNKLIGPMRRHTTGSKTTKTFT